MRKYLFNIFCLVLPLYLFADPNCPVVQPAIINPGTNIECWGTDYEECIVQEWDITIPEDYNYVEFEYIIDLNPNGAIDALYIYTEDENHIEREVLNYNYQPMTGRIQVYTSNQVIRVVLVSQYGNSGEMYRGFKLSYRYADTGIADQVIYSNLGIGIQPQERLHVNGPVRGDGESGSWRIRTTSGTTEIGAANSGYSHFYTDRPAFFFSKPLYINGGVIGSYGHSDLQLRTADTPRLTIDTAGHVGIGTDEPEEALHINGNIRGNGALGALTIRTEAGTTTIGAQGWSYSHFHTSMPRFYFYKPIMVANGEFSSGAGQNLYLQTFNTAINGSSPTTRVTILNSNGNVGIGTDNPQKKLHVVGGALKVGQGSNQASREQNKILIGDSTYIQIGEWEVDDMLSFKANNYNFTNGNVGIENANPQYKLDVNGTIRAKGMKVETSTGADYVFDESYQLQSLDEVEQYIEDNGHLPEIPSAEEMKENGIDVSDFQIKLLQKIEELTLHIIRQDKTIKELQNKVEELSK